jgi:hypothetical protein
MGIFSDYLYQMNILKQFGKNVRQMLDDVDSKKTYLKKN